jgi:hypothetical protein
MSMLLVAPEIRGKLSPLLKESLTVGAGLAGLISYFWALLVVSPLVSPSLSSWIGLVVLILSTSTSYVLKSYHLLAATYLLIWARLGSERLILMVLSYRTPISCILS